MTKPDTPTEKIRQWIESGRDPRSAHWQAGLEAVMDAFKPLLVPGRLSPVDELDTGDITLFRSVFEIADLSPGLLAAYLPPAIAGKVTPPDSAEELVRINPETPSHKLLILRTGKDQRVMCAELSPHAQKPGADLFQDGGLLGSYDYQTPEECLSGLPQVIRAHMWYKGTWSLDEHRRYTLAWFEKVMALGTASVQVDPNFSFLHSPTLIKGNKIDALFMLIEEFTEKRCIDPEGSLKESLSALKGIADPAQRNSQAAELAERSMLECLNLMRDLELVKFADFSERKNEQFKNGFSRTLHQIADCFTSC